MDVIQSALLNSECQGFSQLQNSLDYVVSSTVCDLRIQTFLDELLEKFVIANYLGPLPTAISQNSELITEIVESLSYDGNEIDSTRVHCLPEFWICRTFVNAYLSQNCENFPLNMTVFLIRLEAVCIYLHQFCILRNRSPTLKEQLESCLTKFNTIDKTYAMPERAEILIITCSLLIHYFEFTRAEQCLQEIQSIVGIHADFSGELGKRTKFQIDVKTQLFLSIQRQSNDDGVATNVTVLPKVVDDADSILLPDVIFEKHCDTFNDLNCHQQAYLCLLSDFLYYTRPKDTLYFEENFTLFNYLLKQERCATWAMKTEALFKRASLERGSIKRLERCLSQLEELSSQFARPEPNFKVRLSGFYLSRMPSIPEIQLQLALVLRSLGLIKQALEIYEKWNSWSDIVDCYVALGRREDAEKLIYQMIAINGESADMLCTLGDVTKVRAHYLRAWEVSKQKSARAMRSLAYIFMVYDKNHDEACECFEKSLKLNGFQPSCWFTYGCCCLTSKKWSKAENAFKRCIQIEPDNFEAWNNCALAQIRSGRKHEAFALYQEALKCNYEDWRIWDNLLAICVDIGEFNRAINTYQRLLDLNRHKTDIPVLSILVKAVVTNVTARDGTEASSYWDKLNTLFCNISKQVTNDGEFWCLYAELLQAKANPKPDTIQRILTHLRRAYRCYTESDNWMKTESESEKLIDLITKQITFSNILLDNNDSIKGEDALRRLGIAISILITKVENRPQEDVPTEAARSLISKLKSVEQNALDLLNSIGNK